jgi:hypothetical protein
MLDAPSIFCRVTRPMRYPIWADPGDVLAVWPGHPEMTISVLTADAGDIKRAMYRPEGMLYGDLLNLYLDAVMVPVSAQDEERLLRSA